MHPIYQLFYELSTKHVEEVHSFPRDSSGLKAAFSSAAAGRPSFLLLCNNTKALDFYRKPPLKCKVFIWSLFYSISCWISLMSGFFCFVCQTFSCFSNRSGECTWAGSSYQSSQLKCSPFKQSLSKPVSTYGGLRTTICKGKAANCPM